MRGGGFKHFWCLPREMIQFDEHIFQMGSNYQLGYVSLLNSADPSRFRNVGHWKEETLILRHGTSERLLFAWLVHCIHNLRIDNSWHWVPLQSSVYIFNYFDFGWICKSVLHQNMIHIYSYIYLCSLNLIFSMHIIFISSTLHVLCIFPHTHHTKYSLQVFSMAMCISLYVFIYIHVL